MVWCVWIVRSNKINVGDLFYALVRYFWLVAVVMANIALSKSVRVCVRSWFCITHAVGCYKVWCVEFETDGGPMCGCGDNCW